MVSFNLKSKRVGNGKNGFKTYNVNNIYTKKNNLKNADLEDQNCPTTYKTITNCSGESRNVYCRGRVFRRPIPGYRKESLFPLDGVARCTIATQEIYKDSHAKYHRKDVCYDKRIRSINNKGGVKNYNYNYDYNQYLKN